MGGGDEEVENITQHDMFTAKHNTAQSVDDVFLMNNTATEEYR
jgi:hypothetical protein